jgi:hypothetical protein
MASAATADDDGDFWGAAEYFGDKANPFAVGNWVGLVSLVEGRDKLLKMVQFTARVSNWQSAQSGDAKQEAAWSALYKSIQEGRKSARLLKGINKINQLFTDLPLARTSYEKALIAGNHICLALHWHFDYLAHAHRSKFVQFEAWRLSRISRMPSFVWSVGNVCQILLGVEALRKSAIAITKIREKLATAPTQLRGELEEGIQVLRVQRFKGWLQVAKGFADLVTSGSMAGLEVQKRFPSMFGWLSEPAIGLSGVVSASAVLLNNFPTRATAAGKEEGGWETLQKERNIATAVFAYMQLSTLIKARVTLA